MSLHEVVWASLKKKGAFSINRLENPNIFFSNSLWISEHRRRIAKGWPKYDKAIKWRNARRAMANTLAIRV